VEKQVNKARVVRVLTGIAAVVAVAAFVVVGKFFADYRHRSQAGGDYVFEYRVTWNPAFQGRYVKEVPDLTVAAIYRRHAMGAC